MGSAAEKLATFDALYHAIGALPAGLTGEILEPGIIRTRGRPGGLHRIAARGTWRALRDDDGWDGGSGWWFEQEAGVRLLEDRLAVPDLSAWRLAEGEGLPPAFAFVNPIRRVPDWCCEVLSPRSVSVDRELKLPVYAQAGVAWAWLVDPERQELEVWCCRSGAPELVERHAGVVQQAIAPFRSIVDTSRWWAEPPAGPHAV